MQHSRDNSSASTPTSPAPRLPELRIPIADLVAWAGGLPDYEAGWFFRLVFTSAASEMQGYLRNSSNLWQLAGARRADFWESHKSGVLARFKSREVDGIEWLYFPPLLDLIHQQTEQLREWRAKRARAAHTHSLTDVGSKNQNQNLSECVKEPRPRTEAAKNAGNTRRTTPLDRLIGG
ncbi:MAG: hypothetical protein LAQ69_19625 [Acidobacteriia bacterium]|nr:hypothetical protein [Terriglobia bacterium]MBZ5679575.1 hypothetical protein [Terriglobia bacterium]